MTITRAKTTPTAMRPIAQSSTPPDSDVRAAPPTSSEKPREGGEGGEGGGEGNLGEGGDEEPDSSGETLYGEFVLLIAVGGLSLALLGLLCQRLDCFWKWRASRRLSCDTLYPCLLASPPGRATAPTSLHTLAYRPIHATSD